MDPLSVAANVINVLSETIRCAKGLYDLRDKYRDAYVTITSIYSESMVISAALSQVQNLLLHDALGQKPDLEAAFDTALTGCMVVYSCLDEEVQRLAGSGPPGGDLGWRERSRIVWEEDRMKELLLQIRGQQTAMTLLIQGLQMESLGDIRRLLRENSGTLEQIATRSKSLRSTHPRIKVPDSIFKANDNAKSGVDANSIISQAEFDFDDQVVNSKAYRRAMAAAEARNGNPKPQAEVVQGDLINFDDPEDEPQLQALSDTLEELQNLDLSGVASNADAPVFEDLEPDPFLDDIERSYLPFMPPIVSTKTGSTSNPVELVEKREDPERNTAPTQGTVDAPTMEEEKPPLPPRRSAATAQLTDHRSPLVTNFTGTSSHLSSNLDDSSSAVSSSSTRTAVESMTTVDSRPLRSEESSPQATSASSVPRRKPLSEKSQSNLDLFKTLSSENDDIKVVSAREIDRHTLWAGMIQSESDLISRLSSFNRIFVIPVLSNWPVLAKHLEALQMIKELIALHKDHFRLPMNSQISQSPFATCDPQFISAWVAKSQVTYRTYHQRLPHAQHAIRLTLSTNAKFRSFVNTLGLRPVWLGKTWEDFTNIPTLQVQLYIDNLNSILGSYDILAPGQVHQREVEVLKQSLHSLQKLQYSCRAIQEKSMRREQLQSLYRRIQTLNSDFLNVLNISDPARTIIHQGALAVRIKGKGPWKPVHAVLLDNNLFWGKVRSPKTGETNADAPTEGKFWILEEPLTTTELSATLPDVDNQFVKATVIDEVPRGSVIYQFFVKTNTLTHTLGTLSVRDRQMWMGKIGEATALDRSEQRYPGFSSSIPIFTDTVWASS
ncbi:uncharacterized protein BDZ99DRAFT_200839 [Mytilinidion resinicola]|uniref:PH domain-containing protein n=1 Tax=Mytilinidion resinicola TaxID=574789 RepID=A0A6A6Y1P1_9PEZI|nr:uncharacterized protein BDZ99DRAFT_200839 [Mytilinidion resinicola]KAF2802570.1 hypothetical protein BDZ99DRAFT_200839 [Mytilinidion resinicola]